MTYADYCSGWHYPPCDLCRTPEEAREEKGAKVRCRHARNSWVIAAGYMLWCYRCGALLQMEPRGNGIDRVPGAKWIKPVGPDGKNPADKLIFRGGAK